MGIKESIGWTDRTLNPIKGICKGGCWYCWTKPLYKRKFLTPEIRLETGVFSTLPKTPKRVFLCSTHDLFGNWIIKEWRDLIFDYITLYPQHTYQILTKFPQNIDRPMPDNVWLGVSITGNKPDDLLRANNLIKTKARIKFISYEPLLGKALQGIPYLDWIIIGRLTGHSRKWNPKKEWIKSIVLSYQNIPIFLKDNLKEIWGEPLIQEMPE